MIIYSKNHLKIIIKDIYIINEYLKTKTKNSKYISNKQHKQNSNYIN